MAAIDVQIEERAQTYESTVTVTESGTSTTHRVTVSQEDYRRLTGGKIGPERLIEASFEFLLERESKESILRSFNLMTIARYFPEYESQIGDRL